MRPVLLGMNNPNSEYPEFSLYPDPPGCAGWNLWKHSGLSREEYLEQFERMNMLNGRQWIPSHAREAAEELRTTLASRTVVLLGEDVARLMWVGDTTPHYKWVCKPEGGWWAKIPHPSGRCRHWNDPWQRAAIQVFLGELVTLEGEPMSHDEPAPEVPEGGQLDLFG